MNAPKSFQLASTPLNKGATLLEASAGTGKTYTLAGLVLRLVLEEGLAIEEILAVTYTVAATEELRERVRRRLHEALEDLRQKKTRDEILQRYLKNETVEQGVRRLELAVLNFDEAQIFTIHGFCQRVLRENAFESGALFDAELLADPAPILDEVARDFWRREFYNAQPLLARLALARGLTHRDWRKLLDRTRNHPDIRILPGDGGDSSEKIALLLEDKFREILAVWKKSGCEVKAILAEDKNLSRAGNTFRDDQVNEIIGALEQLAGDAETMPVEALSALEKTSAKFLRGATKPKKTPPEHPFFDVCEEFRTLSAAFFNQLTHEFLAFAKCEIPLRKDLLNVVTYDDLLTRLRAALRGTSGKGLASLLKSKYRAALIDEFQDTDPVQHEVFHRIFGNGEHHFYLIGDPKQAIYGFRGADVFTYLGACDEARETFTLDKNWRSEKPLVDAINLLFEEKSGHPSFKLKKIEYRTIAAAVETRKEFSRLAGKNLPAHLQFRFLKSDGADIIQSRAEESISLAVVADIARLKTGDAKLGVRQLDFSDIAVLVRSNAQAGRLQEMLRVKGIKSVLQSDESVFHTAQATELLRFLQGLSEAGNDPLFKSALATSLVGCGVADLVSLDSNEKAREEMQALFFELSELCKTHGFIAMFRRLLLVRKVRERLVQQPGGERSLTNFLQLAELAHGAETSQHLAPKALCAWIRRQREDGKKSDDENQLRLESDADAVLISTIHKSKGLEYPVVYCPFLWKPAVSKKRSEVLFHNREQGEKNFTLDLSEEPGDQHLAWADEELLAESLRVLYVAVTRAKNRCFVYAGDISSHADSPLGWLLGEVPPLAAIESLAEKSGGCIGVTLIDGKSDSAENFAPDFSEESSSLRAKIFYGQISRTQMIASFSGLTSGASREERDRDETPSAKSDGGETQADLVLGDFERGVRAGLFLHDVMERLDFQKPDDVEQLVSQTMTSHGIPPQHRGAICSKLREVLIAPLAPGLSLSRVAWCDRLAEVEFSYPVRCLNPEILRDIFSKHYRAGLPHSSRGEFERLEFRPVEGFMRGFIDLLFHFKGRYYLVDWKSNWLGNRPADYDGEGMARCMSEHSYRLQYQLYTVAADLYLRRRVQGYDYDKHFGGVFYIFLRGVDPLMAGRGIFHDKPDAALVRELRETFHGGAR